MQNDRELLKQILERLDRIETKLYCEHREYTVRKLMKAAAIALLVEKP